MRADTHTDINTADRQTDTDTLVTIIRTVRIGLIMRISRGHIITNSSATGSLTVSNDSNSSDVNKD